MEIDGCYGESLILADEGEYKKVQISYNLVTKKESSAVYLNRAQYRELAEYILWDYYGKGGV